MNTGEGFKVLNDSFTANQQVYESDDELRVNSKRSKMGEAVMSQM